MNIRPGLSEREIQVLKLVAARMNNRAIAAELKISRRTVETHRAKMRMRTQLGTEELIEFARSSGILEKDAEGVGTRGEVEGVKTECAEEIGSPRSDEADSGN